MEGFQFTFSAATLGKLTEPMTPPRNSSPSWEVKSVKSAGSLSDGSENFPSPPMTDYKSSYSVSHDTGADLDDSLSEMATLSPSPPMSSKVSSETPAITDVHHATPSSSMTHIHTFEGANTTKRTFSDRTTSTPPVSPKKKKSKVSSAIRTALEQSPKGLLKFLKKCTPAEYKGQVQ
jgi:hypothetical protein